MIGSISIPNGHALVKDLEFWGTEVRETPYRNVVLQFGKHRGEAKDVPVGYLLWVLDNFEDLWRETVRPLNVIWSKVES
jgi:hypothetical protein